MYRKILVTTDGSDLARLALAEVAHLAGEETEVVVVQVVDTVGHIVAQSTPAGFEMQGMGRFSVDTAQQVITGQHQAAEEHLAEVQAALQAAGITRTHGMILEGLPGSSIAQAASESDCDVIVMATHGRSGLKRTVLGSVADYVVRHVTVPVLLVRPHEAEEGSRDAEKAASQSN